MRQKTKLTFALAISRMITLDDLLHENDGGNEVSDEPGEGDDALDHALDPEGEDLDEVEAVRTVLKHTIVLLDCYITSTGS